MTRLTSPASLQVHLNNLKTLCNRRVNERWDFFWRNLPTLPRTKVAIVLGGLVHDMYFLDRVNRSLIYGKEELPTAEEVSEAKEILKSAKFAVPNLIILLGGSDRDQGLQESVIIFLGFLGREYPEVVRPAIPLLARRLEELMDKNQAREIDDPIPNEVTIAINIAQAFSFIAESQVQFLRPFTPVLQKASKFPELHTAHIAGEILEKLRT
ncbi:MAG: hypothetical protein WC632_05690 [Candidatus Margulisiibacteriota bacterium]